MVEGVDLLQVEHESGNLNKNSEQVSLIMIDTYLQTELGILGINRLQRQTEFNITIQGMAKLNRGKAKYKKLFHDLIIKFICRLRLNHLNKRPCLMQNHNNNSLWTKGFNWIANRTFRQIPALISSYSIKNSQPKPLFFQDYLASPKLAKEAGLLCAKQSGVDFGKRKQGIKKAVSQFKATNSPQIQKPHEFYCPICLELINGPVTTSCGHSFCHMCIDEAVLFNENCPVCRNFIRGEELVISKSIQTIISMFLLKFELQEIQKYLKKETQYENWLGRRSIKKDEIDIGDCIDVRDTEFIWCRATIKDIFPKDCVIKGKREAVLVHYEGWANVFDEVISLESQRLATFKFYTSRKQIPHYNLSQDNPEHLRSAVVVEEPINAPPPFFEDSFSQSDALSLIGQESMESQSSYPQEQMIRRNLEEQQYQENQEQSDMSYGMMNSDSVRQQYLREIQLEEDDFRVRDFLDIFPNRSYEQVSINNSGTRSLSSAERDQEESVLWSVNHSNLEQRMLQQLRGQELKIRIVREPNCEEESEQESMGKNLVCQVRQQLEKPLVLGTGNSSAKLKTQQSYLFNESQSQLESRSRSVSQSSQFLSTNSLPRLSNPVSQKQEHRVQLWNDPFVSDIQKIQFKQIDEELESLGEAQKEINSQILLTQQQVKQDLKRWNELNAMIENYIKQCPNPETFINEQDPFSCQCQHQHQHSQHQHSSPQSYFPAQSDQQDSLEQP